MRPGPPPDTTHLYLVRHGATAANEQVPYTLQGDAIDLPLSAIGERQAAAVGRLFSDIPVQHVYSSQLVRAVQTAQAVATAHQLQIQKIPELAECNVGRWEGLTWEIIRQQDPKAYRLFQEDPSQNPYLGGESYSDVFRRVQPHLQRLLEQHRGETIVVVSHSVVNRAWLGQLLGVPPRRAKDLRQQNGGVNLISHGPHGTLLLTVNSTFHLDEPPLL